jgi:hypothetical protein
MKTAVPPLLEAKGYWQLFIFSLVFLFLSGSPILDAPGPDGDDAQGGCLVFLKPHFARRWQSRQLVRKGTPIILLYHQ